MAQAAETNTTNLPTGAAAAECSNHEAALRYLCWLDGERTALAHELRLLQSTDSCTWITVPCDRFAMSVLDSGPASSRAKAVLRLAGVSLEPDQRAGE